MNNTLFIILLSALLTFASQEWEQVHIIVASKSGLSNETALRFPYNDAEKLHQTLAELSNVKPRNNHLIQTESADQLRLQLFQIQKDLAHLKESNKKILLQFYYSGHGSGSNFHIGNNKVSFKEVKSILQTEDIDARIFVLDVCYGGTFLQTKGFSKAAPIAVNLDLEHLTKGEVTISSSAIDEQSYEVSSLEGSVFSTNWIMGLRGAGDVNRDGKVSLFEVYSHAYDHTVNYTSQELNTTQHPSYNMELTGAHDIVLTSPSLSSHGVLFKDFPLGTYTIFNATTQHTVGDMRITQTGEHILALPSGSYLLTTHSKDGRTLEQELSVDTHMTNVSYHSFVYKKSVTPLHVAKGTDTKTPEPLTQYTFFKKLLAHSGFYFSNKTQYHSFKSYEQTFNTRSNLELRYSLSDTYTPQNSTLSGMGWGILASVNSDWALLFSGSMTENSYSLNSFGYEPLNIPSTSLPVHFQGSYNIDLFQIGIALQKNILTAGSSTIDIDIGYHALSQEVTYEMSVARTALQFEPVQSNYTDTGSGTAYTLSATYRYNWHPTFTFALGSRLSAYYIDLSNTFTIDTQSHTETQQELGGAFEFLIFIGGGKEL